MITLMFSLVPRSMANVFGPPTEVCPENIYLNTLRDTWFQALSCIVGLSINVSISGNYFDPNSTAAS